MLPVPLKTENVYGATPPDPEKEMVEFINVVWAVGEIVKAGFIVTIEVSVAPKESVTFTVADPAVAGAVYSPEAAFILPPPLNIE